MLELHQISKAYQGMQVLESLNLSIKEGEIYCILGPSGAGKSTLLHILAGIVHQDSGKMILGTNRIGYVFQEDRLLPWLTVEENICLVNETLSSEALNHLLSEMDLESVKNQKPDVLSGGMRQRVSIARAFAIEPSLLLLDEPFKSLDYALKAKIIETLLGVWRERKITVVFVTHDIEEALWTADRIAILGKHPVGLKDVIEVEHPRRLDENEQVQFKKKLQLYWEENL
ncbi:ABC transporter ATP-binding protein [Fusibacter tunisiensis]|uniref:NitT/TauT family transport system ATP-binding protein n=1 Tax=Fusibacter tunisiensis TaxID=1008308 RepID=A0ABS2MPD9_9FIRM|nr:ATP-binding cassette domain-containing protein [Fusibacter tunisiensis]MBM7561265.1 NitT/TauT family transport system ATP-binding protein [Fusibacter tunisiensis]